MRKEPKPSKGNGLINLIFIVVIGYLGYGAYQQGYLDNLINEFQGGHSFTSIEGTTCDELKESAIGRKLTNNLTEEATEVMGVRNIKEVKRNQQELVCRGEVLAKGIYETITITLSDWDGDLFVEWEVSW
jgi:hypothetical protein